MARVRIIGAGLAGCEAALQLASRGHEIDLVEMRPVRMTPAHTGDGLAELVCSNSFRSSAVTNAVGLLKGEMEILGSEVLAAGNAARVPAGDAFAVDREQFTAEMTRRIAAQPRIALRRQEAVDLEFHGSDFLVIATGPLTSQPLFDAIRATVGGDDLYFYDAIAPIVAADSLDMSKLYWKSRYDKGSSSDYLNAPMNEQEYVAFVEAVRLAEVTPFHDFENAAHFEGCLPIEEMASRGLDTLRYGPMKPVGLDHPVTGERAHAVVQLRKEDLSDEFFNLVGFQTKMKIGEQRRILSMIPGLENVSVARWGSMHRNTFLNGPRHLTATFELRNRERIFFAGQITGVEGYVESAATGLLAALFIDAAGRGERAVAFPRHTALGGLSRHVTESSPDRYQPSNVTWALIEDVTRGQRMKKEQRRRMQAEQALESVRSLAKPQLALSS
jgi:methylenetetrahydrofolate--tRNA-(uracil-5-)-methyltransferase